MNSKLLAFLLFLSFANLLCAEDEEEKLFSTEEETYHANEMSELLEKLRADPINLNYANPKELLQLPWFSEKEVEKIIKFRKKQNFTNAKELKKIGINSITISEIENYVDFTSKKEIHFSQRTRTEFKEENKNEPSSLKYYQRTLFSYENFYLGFLSQKDELEKDLLDYYSYFIHYKNENWLRNLIVGKYRLALGQGILFAPKLGLSKSGAATSTPKKNFNSIKPYTSSYEIWDLEGSAAELRLKNVSVIPYFSQTKLSANLEDDKITSFNLTGLNYDSTQKDNVTETILGSACYYHFYENYLGVNFHKLSFDKEFSDATKENDYLACSFDLALKIDKIPVFSEFAIVKDKTAFVSGLKLEDENLRQLFLVRKYDKNFPTWHGKPFSAQSTFDNELGFYYGITFLPRRKMKINCYFDLWKYPETRYFEKMPTVGSEQFLQLETKFSDQSLRITLQHKDKEKYISLENAQIRQIKRTTLRTDWWQLIANCRFKNRLEFVSEYLPEEKIWEKGFLAYQQIKFQYKNLETVGQIAAFHSQVLHYMYEYNVDGIMQNSILSDDGLFYFLLVKFHFSEHFEIQSKISDFWDRKEKQKIYLQLITQF